MNDCNFCAYRIKEDDRSNQTCSKWVRNDDFSIPCTPSDGEIGGPPSSDSDNCVRMDCPAHCFYPYTKDVYNSPASDDEYYDTLGLFPDYNALTDNPELLSSYVRHANNPELLKTELREYDSLSVPDNLDLKCGILDTPDENETVNFPALPSQEVLREIVEHNVDLQNRGTNWATIKYTDKLVELYSEFINEAQTEVIIGDFTIPITENGIELEWWEREPLLNEDQLRRPLPQHISEYQSLESIHSITGGVLEYAFSGHTVDTMVIEEIYGWLRLNNIETELNQDGSQNNNYTMASFFGITADEVTDRDFQICMNELLITEHDDNEFIKRISLYDNLSELGDGNHRQDLLYVESKIIKFLTIQPYELKTCFDIVYITNDICEVGLTKNPTKMLGSLLKLNTDNVDDENYDENMRIVSNRLLKYLPEIIEKIIDISEYYEDYKCNGEIHKNTKLLKEIYSSLFEQSLTQRSFPSLGITEFFDDFHKNIFTKIILLIFIAYLISQFIHLFKVNVNIK
jgi:hypothetical protein